MVFEIGKCYKHSAGDQMKIIGEANTTAWGNCLLGESYRNGLGPVGRTKDNASNWSEISEEEWMKNFS